MKHYTVHAGCISWNVRVTSDVNSPGTLFAHEAASDLDYYGYRETEYDIVSAQMHLGLYGECELNREEIDSLSRAHSLMITELVQKEIDKEKDDIV